MKKVKIQIDYENTKTSMEIEPHQKIKYIKQNFGRMFYPVHKELKLYHKNKDISSYENMMIGNVFKNKSQIIIKATEDKIFQTPHTNRQEKSMSDNSLANINSKKPHYNFLCKCDSPFVSLYCRRCQEFECVICQEKIV